MSEKIEVDLSEFKDPVVINNTNYYRSREIALYLGLSNDRNFFSVVDKTIKLYFKKSRGDWFKSYIDDRIIINKDFIYIRYSVKCGEHSTWKYDYLLSSNGLNLCSNFSNRVKYTIKGVTPSNTASKKPKKQDPSNTASKKPKKQEDVSIAKEIDLKDFKETKIINGIEYYSSFELSSMLQYCAHCNFIDVVNRAIKFYTKKSKLDWLGNFINDRIIISQDFIYSRCKIPVGDSKGWTYKYIYLLSAKGVNLCIQFSSHLKCTVKDSRIDIVNQLDKIHTSKFNNLTDVIRENSDGTEYISARDFGELLGYYQFSDYIPTLQYALEIWNLNAGAASSANPNSIGFQGNDEYTTLDTRDFDDLTKNVVRFNGDVIRVISKINIGDTQGYKYKYDYHMSINFAFHLLSYSDRNKPKFQELMRQLNDYRIALEKKISDLNNKLNKFMKDNLNETPPTKKLPEQQEVRDKICDNNTALQVVFSKIIETFIAIKNVLFKDNLARTDYINRFTAKYFNNFYLGFYNKTKEEISKYRKLKPNSMGNYIGVNFLDYLGTEEGWVICNIRNKFLATIEPILNDTYCIEKMSEDNIAKMIHSISREFRNLHTITDYVTGKKTYPEDRWDCCTEKLTPTKKEHRSQNNNQTNGDKYDKKTI